MSKSARERDELNTRNISENRRIVDSIYGYSEEKIFGSARERDEYEAYRDAENQRIVDSIKGDSQYYDYY